MANIIGIIISWICYFSGLFLGYTLGVGYGILFGVILFLGIASTESTKMIFKNLVMISYITAQFLFVLIPLMDRVASSIY